MAAMLSQKGKPRGLSRWLFRMPIWLFRARLGALVGSRFMLLEHTGRRSGKLRYTVLEVVLHEEQPEAYFVASGWGTKSDWYQNLEAHPEVTVTVGSKRFTTRAVTISETDATRVLTRYVENHPSAFRALSKFMMGDALNPTPEGARELARHIPVVHLAVPQR